MDSDSEEEIFFGPVTSKEEEIAAPLRNRKTEIFVPNSSLLYHRSLVPSLSSLEEEDCKSLISKRDHCVLNCDSDLTEPMDTCEDNKLKNVLHKKIEGDPIVSTSYEDSCTKVSKEASDSDSLKVSQGNVFEVSKVSAATLSSVSTEVIEDGNLSVKVNGPEIVIHDVVVPSTKALALANADISEVQLLSSLKDIGEISHEELITVTKGIMPVGNTEIERQTLPCISIRVCDNDEPLANVKMRDETLSFADVDVASKVMSSPSKFASEVGSSGSSVRVQEEVVALFDDKSIDPEGGVEDTMEAESTAKTSDIYLPVVNADTGEYSMINSSREAADEAVSLACLTLDERRSVSAVEICEERESVVTSTYLVNAETMKIIQLTNASVAQVSEYANKQKGSEENIASFRPNLDCVSFKGGQDVASVIHEEALPAEISGSGALFECKGYKNALEIHDSKDFKDSNSINNYLSRCFCNDIDVDALLTDKSKDDCMCSKKSSIENQLAGCNRGTDVVSIRASEKLFTTVIENLPSQWSADVINRDINLSSNSGPSLVSTLSDYPHPVDSSSESYGTINKGLIFSQTPNSESGLLSSCSRDCSPVMVTATPSDCEVRSVPFVNSSSESGSELKESVAFEKPTLCNNHDESNTVQSPPKIVNSPLDVSDDGRQSETSSPARKFNDTIEEMEMLLKYGVHYGETGDVRSNCSDIDEKNCVYHRIDCALDDSIVSPRKSSVMSSVSHFNPEFNSTRVPSTKSCVVPAKLEGNVETQGIKELNTNLALPKVTMTLTPATLPKVTKALTAATQLKVTEALTLAALPKVTKALPPPKPPRNALMLSSSPPKSNSFQVPSPKQQVNSHLNQDLPEGKCVLRKDEVVRHGISKSSPSTPKSGSSRFNPSTPQYTGVKSKLNSGILSQKLESKTTNKTPAKIVGVTRSTSLTNMSKENKLHRSVTVSPRCVPSTQVNNALSRHHTPKSQTPRSTAKERVLHKPSHVPHSTPSKCIEKPPIGHISKTVQNVKALNPNPLAKKHTYIRQAGMNIVSPVARYLRENPPPPLVINVKPRHKITGNIEKLTQMDTIKDSTDSADAKCRNAKQRPKNAPVLPAALYSPAVPVLLENNGNKENERSRKLLEISSSSHQLLVMKHKGRVKVPKVKFKDEVNKNSSPKGCKIPNPVEAAVTPVRNSSARGSLMEVSIYEPHRTQYTDTLK